MRSAEIQEDGGCVDVADGSDPQVTALKVPHEAVVSKLLHLLYLFHFLGLLFGCCGVVMVLNCGILHLEHAEHVHDGDDGVDG